MKIDNKFLLIITVTLMSAIASATIESKFEYLKSNLSDLAGPNCNNASLYMSGLIDYVGYTSFGELEAILASELCEKLESPQEGAIGYASGLHSFVYVSDAVIYQKQGWVKSALYEKTSIKNLKKSYDISNDNIDYYSCEKKSYLESNNNISNEIKLLLKEEMQAVNSIYSTSSSGFNSTNLKFSKEELANLNGNSLKFIIGLLSSVVTSKLEVNPMAITEYNSVFFLLRQELEKRKYSSENDYLVASFINYIESKDRDALKALVADIDSQGSENLKNRLAGVVQKRIDEINFDSYLCLRRLFQDKNINMEPIVNFLQLSLRDKELLMSERISADEVNQEISDIKNGKRMSSFMCSLKF